VGQDSLEGDGGVCWNVPFTTKYINHSCREPSIVVCD